MTTNTAGPSLDLEPATRMLADLVVSTPDDQLTAPTPCRDTTVGDLLAHVDGLAQAFAAAARKNPLTGTAAADASNLDPDWRTRIPQRLTELAEAWRDPSAWTGQTAAGGVDLSGEMAGVIALKEVVLHGWDLAVSTRARFRPDPEHVQAALRFVQPTAVQNPQGTPGLFGPPVPVSEDASEFDRLIGLSGRDPAWRP